MEAEKEKLKKEEIHREATLAYLELERHATQLGKQLRKVVNKSRFVLFMIFLYLLR